MSEQEKCAPQNRVALGTGVQTSIFPLFPHRVPFPTIIPCTASRASLVFSSRENHVSVYTSPHSVAMAPHSGASFSYGIPCCLAFDPAFACCLGAREPSSAPPNRPTSEVRCKTSEINLGRLLWICLFRLWRDWRAAVGIVKPETVVAWHRAGFRRPTWTTGHFARGPRSDPQDVPGESLCLAKTLADFEINNIAGARSTQS